MASKTPTNNNAHTPSHFDWDDDVQSEIDSGNLQGPKTPQSQNETEHFDAPLHDAESENFIPNNSRQESTPQDFSEENSSDITDEYELCRQVLMATGFNFGQGRQLYNYEEYPMRGNDYEDEDDEDDYVLETSSTYSPSPPPPPPPTSEEDEEDNLETTHYNFITDSPDKKYSIYLAESYLQTRVNEIIRGHLWYRNTKNYIENYFFRAKRIHDINERRPEYKRGWPDMWKEVDIDKPTKREEWKTYKVRNRVMESFLEDDNNSCDDNNLQSSIIWNKFIDPALLDTPYPSAPSSETDEVDPHAQDSIANFNSETEEINTDIQMELSDTEDDLPLPLNLTSEAETDRPTASPTTISISEEGSSFKYSQTSPTSSISSDTTEDIHMSADEDFDESTEELRELGFEKLVATFGKVEGELWEKAVNNEMTYFERMRYTGCEAPSPSRYCYTVIEN